MFTLVTEAQEFNMMPVVEIVLTSQMPANVPAFLSKLWKMGDNPDSGTVVMDPDLFI